MGIDGEKSLEDLKTPETNEEVSKDVVEETETTEEPKEESEEKVEAKHEFDKDRQREQIELANANRRIAELERQPKATEHVAEDDEDPLETIKVLRQRQENTETLLQQTMQAVNLNKETDAYASHLTQMDNEYGAELRNEALQIATDKAISRGYSLQGTDAPLLRERHDLIEMGYAEAKAKAKPSKSSPSQGLADTGRSGTAASDSNAFRGSPEEILADMEKHGKFAYD